MQPAREGGGTVHLSEPVESLMARARTIALLILAALAVGACGGGTSGDGARQASDELRVDTSGWKTDFARHSVPLSEFLAGGPPRDGIPPIDQPKPTSQRDAEEWLGDREPVLVVEIGDEARAYPVQILVWHEIANDRIGGRPIAVTYCPLCNSSVVFDRRVDDRDLTFGTTGNLRKSDLVMWDRQTESWWQQLTAEAVVGKLSGKRLEVLPSQTLSWADFKRVHPDGDVLSRDTGFKRDYGRNPYVGYDDQDAPILFDGEIDERLPAKERVVAVFAARETAVFPFSSLAREPVVNEEVGRDPVVVLYRRGVVSPLDEGVIRESDDVGTAAVFDRRIDGRTLTFKGRGDRYVDEETASEWDIAGRAVAGSLRGKRLRPVRHDEQFWFALAAFVPAAHIVR
jgi:Protein of unknown function (DUF3179)